MKLLSLKVNPDLKLIRFILNNTEISTTLPPGMVILDFIRYHQHLMGTKIGCREGDCGACTVLVGEVVNTRLPDMQGDPIGIGLHYRSMTSCLMPLGNAAGKHIVTVEGINFPDKLNPVQEAMAEAGATQCGFCTPGFIMSLAGYCLAPQNSSPVAAMDGNICRCTGYKSIERAGIKIGELMKEKKDVTDVLPDYFSTIRERLDKLTSHDSLLLTADSRLPLGGGTDLYVQKHDEMTHAEINFLFDNKELNGIRKEGNKCIVGPSATVTDLKNSPVIREAFPGFDNYAKLVSSTPIRNMATIAGNFINASPIGDFTIFFLALDAQLIFNDGKKKREIPLRKLYKGYKDLDKSPGESIEQIVFDLPGKGHRFHFEKVSKRTHLDIATVNSAILLSIKDDKIISAGLSAGGVAPIPLFLQKTSAFLNGKIISEELVTGAIEIMALEISPISDARGSREYKKLLLGQLVKAHFLSLFPQMEL